MNKIMPRLFRAICVGAGVALFTVVIGGVVGYGLVLTLRWLFEVTGSIWGAGASVAALIFVVVSWRVYVMMGRDE